MRMEISPYAADLEHLKGKGPKSNYISTSVSKRFSRLPETGARVIEHPVYTAIQLQAAAAVMVVSS